MPLPLLLMSMGIALQLDQRKVLMVLGLYHPELGLDPEMILLGY